MTIGPSPDELERTAEPFLAASESASPERDLSPCDGTVLLNRTEHDLAAVQLRLQSTALDAAAHGIGITDASGIFVWVNPAFSRMTGYSREELYGQNPRLLKSGQHDREFYVRLWRTILAGEVWHGEITNRRKDGSLYIEENTITPVRDANGVLSHFITINLDITERKRAEAAMAQAALVQTLNAEVASALIDRDSLDVMLHECAASLVRNMDAAFARIWTLDAAKNVLELQATVGLDTRPNDRQQRIRVGESKIGMIAQTRLPRLTNDVLNDPLIDRDWAQREGMAAFAGYPLQVGQRLVGVVALFARHRFEDGVLDALGSVAKQIALGIDRKRTEIERDVLLTRLQTQIDHMPMAYVLLDAELRVADWNTAATRIFGFTKGEMLGEKPPYNKFVADTFERMDELFVRLHSGEMSADYLNENLTKEGRVIICQWYNTPIFAADGRFEGALCLAQDVTSRIQGERQLREAKQRLEHVVESNPAVIFSVAFEGQAVRPTWVSDNIREMLGHPPEAFYEPGWWFDHIHPDDQPRISDEIKNQLLSEGRATSEFRMRRRDGDYVWLRTETRMLHDDKGGVLEAVGSLSNITERKRLENQFRQSQQRLERVLASSPAVLFTLAIKPDDFPPTWVSDNISVMMGYDAAEALDPNWWHQRVHLEDRERITRNARAEIEATGRITAEYRFRHKDGGYRWIRSEMRVMPGSTTNNDEIVGSWSDITDRKQLEEQFRQAQKMEAIGKLAGGVAHDFNNLLTVILGYSEVYLSQLRPADPLRGPLTEIRRAGERAAGLTRQLLAFSRKQILEPVVLDLNAVLEDIERMLGRVIGEDVALIVRRAPNLWLIKADPGQLEQVLMNLVVNARDAMPRGGKLSIETQNVRLDDAYARSHPETLAGDHILLAISDTGTGIDPAVLPHIFEPFFTTKGPTHGTGLGLATVFGIVKQSGGSIDVESELGRGTTVKIYLPRDRSGEPAASAGPVKELVRGGAETILLVEDEDGVRTLAKAVLQQHGYRVLEARNAGAALLICETQGASIDLLVSDVVMPELSGRELAERLAKIHPKLKVLLMSGYTDDVIVHHGVLGSGAPFLQKPFSPDSLSRKVREVLDRPRS